MLAAQNPDPELERRNVSHEVFMDQLTEAIGVLGGEEWVSSQKLETDDSEADDIDEITFANIFSTLGLDDGSDDEEEDQG